MAAEENAAEMAEEKATEEKASKKLSADPRRPFKNRQRKLKLQRKKMAAKAANAANVAEAAELSPLAVEVPKKLTEN